MTRVRFGGGSRRFVASTMLRNDAALATEHMRGRGHRSCPRLHYTRAEVDSLGFTRPPTTWRSSRFPS